MDPQPYWITPPTSIMHVDKEHLLIDLIFSHMSTDI